jgi:hypothetical protein
MTREGGERLRALLAEAMGGNLALLVGWKAGTYVMRYLRGNDLLAEGQLRLVK